MQQFKGFNRNDIYKDVERLPIGGYVLKIMDAREAVNEWGSSLIISFDIAEGEYKDFFATNYKAQAVEDKKWKGVYRLRVPKDDGTEQDDWTRRRFNTVVVNFEESNPGFHWDWDERKLRGKLIGGIFNNKEYDYNGRHGFFTQCKLLTTVEKIKSGKFTVPEDDLLDKGKSAAPQPKPDADGFVNLPDGIDEELPF